MPVVHLDFGDEAGRVPLDGQGWADGWRLTGDRGEQAGSGEHTKQGSAKREGGHGIRGQRVVSTLAAGRPR